MLLFTMHFAVHALLFLPFSRAHICGPLEDLGPNSWERNDGYIVLDVTDDETDCDFSLKFKFKHDDSFPVAAGPDDCQPGAIADDGIPYLGFRWSYESLPSYMKEVTTVDHISLDYNPCGHPPANVFTVPHYDVHIYMISPEQRTCMTCDMIPDAPICNPFLQTTKSGKAFFNAATVQPSGQLSNMPANFSFGLYDNVPLMGGHSWNPSTQPDLTVGTWTDPYWLMGSYDGGITNYEPMIPLSFITGTEDKYYEEELEYVGQTIDQLPTKYTVMYDHISGFTTISIEGKSAVCGKDFKNLLSAKSSKMKSPKSVKSLKGKGSKKTKGQKRN